MGYGGEGWEKAEAAVRRALEWLRLHQNSDGSWGADDYTEGLTGLGLLTFLAHGETPASQKYGETVGRAIRYLVARQNEKGEFAKIDTTAGTYAQAICANALGEAYGMTRILELKPAMERGVQVLIDGQQRKGGFSYRFAKRLRRDTSLGGWCCQALKAASFAGAENVRLHEAMELAIEDLKSVQNEDGSFRYSHPKSDSSRGLTAAAVLSMQLLGHGRDPEVRNGLNFLGSADCVWRTPPEWPMSTWYYLTQAKFHQGGTHWTDWNNQFAPQFIHSQNADGSWTCPGPAPKDGADWQEPRHPVYATTLAALTLQVYYRFLPTDPPIETKPIDPRSEEDVKIEIL